jgi:3-oxoacyl-[acyl-carrier protein] reductase
MFAITELGLLLACQEAVRHFGPEGGSIVNISSLAARASHATTSVYSATKAAVDAITRSLSQELGPRRIRINSINPGLVLTEGVHTVGFDQGEFRSQIEAQTPLGRVGTPGDIAPAAVFLASDDASWITGETFYIAGGFR